MAKKGEVIFAYSKMKYAVCQLLEREKLIKKIEVLDAIKSIHARKGNKNIFKQIKITFNFDDTGKPIISSIKRISKPGQRIYVHKDEMPRVLNGLGLAIISTSQGLMTDKEARKKKIGGELICEIW